MLVTILVLLLVAALRLGSSLLIPVAFSLLLALLLNPLVRGMTKWKIPESIGAAIMVFGITGLFAFGAWWLSEPASEWLERAPQTMHQMESRLRRIKKPIAEIQKTAERVEQAATSTGSGQSAAPAPAAPSMVARLGYSTASLVGATLTVIFLTYFLLASAPLFKRKLPRMVPEASRRERIDHAIEEIERQMSRYLLLNSVISLIVGLLTWGLLEVIGMPNAPLWATAAFIFNYVPYAGALATTVLIAFAGVVSFDTPDKTLLALGGFTVINLLEGNLITPTILGKTMPLNSLAIFLSLLFWGWVWGVAGAVMAVPLTVMVQIVCAHVSRTRTFAVMLDS